MKPLEIAARFAAFAWYTNCRQAPSRTTQAEARQFANQNWQVFLPVAEKGWGKLLLRVAKIRPNLKHQHKVASWLVKPQRAASLQSRRRYHDKSAPRPVDCAFCPAFKSGADSPGRGRIMLAFPVSRRTIKVGKVR